ncbi:MAG: DHH family phosphoesterase [Acidimicrobiia bacterium]|nr:DHH family phosphoesterase [Acidimicrobiia bacterium]
MCADLPADPSLPYAEVGAVLEAAGRIGLTCHVNPDPDALGSLLAMHHGLAQLGCSVVSSFPRPFRLSPGLAWLPGTAELVPPDDFPERVDVLMTFDAADLDRLHEFRHHADLAGTVVVVDHHRTNTGFGAHHLIDPHAASSGNVVAALLETMHVELTPPIATCLYAALAADTGRFSFRADAATFAYAARLVAAGADGALVAARIWGAAPLAALRLLGEVLVRMEHDCELSFVSSYVTNLDLQAHGVDRADIEDFVETLRRVRDAEVACLFRELVDGRVKASLRGRGAVDLGGIAAALGGGGHHDAAGFDAESFETAREQVRAALDPRLRAED